MFKYDIKFSISLMLHSLWESSPVPWYQGATSRLGQEGDVRFLCWWWHRWWWWWICKYCYQLDWELFMLHSSVLNTEWMFEWPDGVIWNTATVTIGILAVSFVISKYGKNSRHFHYDYYIESRLCFFFFFRINWIWQNESWFLTH